MPGEIEESEPLDETEPLSDADEDANDEIETEAMNDIEGADV